MQLRQLQKDQIIEGRYKVVKEVGSGATAKVYKALDIQTSKFVAIKYNYDIQFKEQKDIEYIEQEAKFLMSINHPNIMKCFGIFKHSEEIYIILEFIDGTTLDEFIKSYFKGIPFVDDRINFKELYDKVDKIQTHSTFAKEYNQLVREAVHNAVEQINLEQNTNTKEQVLQTDRGSGQKHSSNSASDKVQGQTTCKVTQNKQNIQEQPMLKKKEHHIVENQFLYMAQMDHIFRQIIDVLKFLNNKHYIHRDLKPQNIMITKDSFQIKLIDFGFSCMDKPESLKTGMIGTPIYIAPEVLFKNSNKQYKYDTKVDVWSTGVILYQMLYGHLPFLYSRFPKFDIVQLQNCLILPEDLFGNVDEVDDKYKRIVRNCLLFDSTKRASPLQLMKMLDDDDYVDILDAQPKAVTTTITKTLEENFNYFYQDNKQQSEQKVENTKDLKNPLQNQAIMQQDAIQLKVVFMGDFGTGKTTLQNTMLSNLHVSTNGEFKQVHANIEAQNIKFDLLFVETRGKEENTKQELAPIISNCNICFLVYSTKVNQSFYSLPFWQEFVEKKSSKCVFYTLCNLFDGDQGENIQNRVDQNLFYLVSKQNFPDHIIKRAAMDWQSKFCK